MFLFVIPLYIFVTSAVEAFSLKTIIKNVYPKIQNPNSIHVHDPNYYSATCLFLMNPKRPCHMNQHPDYYRHTLNRMIPPWSPRQSCTSSSFLGSRHSSCFHKIYMTSPNHHHPKDDDHRHHHHHISLPPPFNHIQMKEKEDDEDESYPLSDDSLNCNSYTGPMFQGDDSEFIGGITLIEHSVQLLVGPSEIALGQVGLFISLFISDEVDDEDDDDDPMDGIKEKHYKDKRLLLLAGTPICGYSRGYFTDTYQGDKSVGFQFHGYANTFAVFYDKKLVSLDKAIEVFLLKQNKTTIINTHDGGNNKDILYGHIVTTTSPSSSSSMYYIQPDPTFHSRIFVPEITQEEQENHNNNSTLYSAPYLGMYANDFAYDPNYHTLIDYQTRSEQNNILDLAWRLTEGTLLSEEEETNTTTTITTSTKKELLLIPTWPVVKIKSDVYIINEIPMELGLQYGFTYWDAYHHNRNKEEEEMNIHRKYSMNQMKHE